MIPIPACTVQRSGYCGKRDGTRRAELAEIDAQLQVDEKQLQARKATDKRQWYVNTEGQTFVILNADKPFRMGSPDGEPNRRKDEVPHQQRIGRTFAIASKIVTKAQFRHFQQANPDVRKVDIEQYSRTDDSPAGCRGLVRRRTLLQLAQQNRGDSQGAMVL